ncbi:MAG: phosphatase PAP2 family protein, partial [Persicimonas sp.]
VYLWWRSWKGDEVSATESKEASKVGRRGKPKARVHRFMWGYLIFNLLGFMVWVLFPVAPPWYVEQYGFGAPGEAIPGDPAALARVDAVLGYAYFSSIYREATYIFGAMPSLHVAPAFWIVLWARIRPIKGVAALYAAMMSFFAVYLGHHYIIDVLAGAALASAVYYALAHTRLGELPDRAAARIKSAIDDLLEPRAQQEAPSEA